MSTTEPNLAALPLFVELSAGRNILIAGAGGGFDIFSGLPLYFFLQNAGKTVHLANLSFSRLTQPAGIAGRRVTSHCYEVTADSVGSDSYFPEKHLSRWFRDRGDETSIYCFDSYSGPKVLLEAYEHLVSQMNIDTIVLVDGGTDSLMFGDEEGLGTPSEDMSSICAVDQLTVDRQILVSLGFGIDSFHRVCHAHVLENIAQLTRQGGYLGAVSLLANMPEVSLFQEATRFVLERTPERPSIVCTSILSAIEGEFGDKHSTTRTRGEELFINPLMSLYWAFKLKVLAENIPYLSGIRALSNQVEVADYIKRYRRTLAQLRQHKVIPI